jgi:hypothetical protein
MHMPMPNCIGLAAAALVVNFLFGFAAEILCGGDTHQPSLSYCGEPAWAIAMLGSALFFRLGLFPSLSHDVNWLRSLAFGALLFPMFLGVFVLGFFSPYLLNIGRRTPSGVVTGDYTSWQEVLAANLLIALILGLFVGSAVGILSWRFRGRTHAAA